MKEKRETVRQTINGSLNNNNKKKKKKKKKKDYGFFLRSLVAVLKMRWGILSLIVFNKNKSEKGSKGRDEGRDKLVIIQEEHLFGAVSKLLHLKS